jgi:pyridoxamine 5'-phosphate oxidase
VGGTGTQDGGGTGGRSAGCAPAGDADPYPYDDEELLRRVRAAPVLAGELPRFDPAEAPDAPGPLFARWLDRALADRLPEPHVMTLSTASPDGTPSARVLMLRGIDTQDCGYVFASDSRSRKGRDLAANPRAALTFYWPAHGRQVRLTGPVTVLGPQITRQDFLGRSPASRAAGFTGRQSAPLSGPQEYERARRAAQEVVAAEPGSVPETHTVYRLRAREAEFFQADPARGHLRLRYERTAENGWIRTLLWP